eukprot:6501875-Prymnesium_polylepis.1
MVSAFPDMDGLFEEQLVCTVTDNPQPVLFPISAIGSTPAVAVDASEVVFERMLLKRDDTKAITLSSRSALPVRWAVRAEDLLALAGGEGERQQGEEDFTVTPTSGMLAPGGDVQLFVTFHARE